MVMLIVKIIALAKLHYVKTAINRLGRYHYNVTACKGLNNGKVPFTIVTTVIFRYKMVAISLNDIFKM